MSVILNIRVMWCVSLIILIEQRLGVASFSSSTAPDLTRNWSNNVCQHIGKWNRPICVNFSLIKPSLMTFFIEVTLNWLTLLQRSNVLIMIQSKSSTFHRKKVIVSEWCICNKCVVKPMKMVSSDDFLLWMTNSFIVRSNKTHGAIDYCRLTTQTSPRNKVDATRSD
jgi:hypothetical protein